MFGEIVPVGRLDRAARTGASLRAPRRVRALVARRRIVVQPHRRAPQVEQVGVAFVAQEQGLAAVADQNPGLVVNADQRHRFLLVVGARSGNRAPVSVRTRIETKARRQFNARPRERAMTPRKDLAIDASCSVRELLTRQRQNGWDEIAPRPDRARWRARIRGLRGRRRDRRRGIGRRRRRFDGWRRVTASGASATLSGASALARATPRVDGSDKARAPEDQDKAD